VPLDPADRAAGPVSQPRYSIGFSGSDVLVTVDADPAKATGEDSYLLTVHPAANLSAERVVNFSIPADGIATSAGSLPGAKLDLAPIVLDSKAPTAIPLTNFTPVSRPPLENCFSTDPAACGDDFYKVHRATAAEEGEKLGFFNSAADLSDGALLQRKNAEGTGTVPAIFDVAGISGASNSPSQLSIGNGTGRDSSVPGSRALNNQTSDDLVAVQWDPIGNTVITALNNSATCQQNGRDVATCPEQPMKGNDVTGPALSYTVSMDVVDATTPSTASVPVRTTITGGNDNGVHTNTLRTPVEAVARPEHVRQVAGSNPAQFEVVSGHVGADKRSTTTYTPTAPTATLISNVDVSNGTLFPQDELLRSQVRLVDVFGNASANKPSQTRLKDTLRPELAKVSLIDVNSDGDADKGDIYRVEFNDAINTSDLDSGAEVNERLTVADPSAACGTSDTNSPPLEPCANWGDTPTASWSPDGRLLSITLGAPCTIETCAGKASVLPKTGDVVTAAASIRDKNLNAFAAPKNTITIAPPAVLPLLPRTIDSVNVGSNVFSTGRDGVLDAIDVEFTGALKSDTVAGIADNIVIKSGDALVVPATAALAPGTDDTVRLSFTVPAAHKSLFGTGATPVVTLQNNDDSTETGLVANNGDKIATFSATAADRAGAVPVSMKTGDGDNDGKLDRAVIQFSEAIVHGQENPCGYWVTGYGDAAYAPAEFGTNVCPSSTTNPASNKPSPATAGATASDTVVLTLPEKAEFDTHVTPQVSYSSTKATPAYPLTQTTPARACLNAGIGGATTPNCPIKDASGNNLASFTGTAQDAAGPAIVERNTLDSNSDGRLDEIRIKFSENLSTPSIVNAQFTVSDPAYTILGLDVIAQRELGLRLENIAAGTGDTGVKPKLTFLGGTTDVASAPTTADSGVVVTDKAGPALLGACASSPTGTNGQCPVDDAATDKVTLLFSETITGSSVAQTDFVVEQPAGTAKTQTAAPVVEADNKRVTLTFAQGAINSAADGVVRLAAAGAVTDAAAPVNASTQTTNVPLFRVPTVTLDLSCPTPANPGYCVDNRIDTGAAGTSGILKWRLASTPRGTTPADSEFKETIPAKYPEAGTPLADGKHTLYLSGKDAFGRLSAEVSDTITVLYAPRITSVQMVNSETTRLKDSYSDTSTVRDGDSLKIGADAYGTDAAEWAQNNAPTGGFCLAAHMALNAKPLTGKSTDTGLAPIRCDLNPVASSGPYRRMEFPVLKVSGTTRYPVGTVVKVTDSEAGSMIVDGPNGTQLRRPFISQAARRSWMISDASVIKVQLSMLSALPKGPNLGYRNGALLRSGTGYYYVENGVKRPVSTTQLSAWRMPTTTAYAPTTTELKGMPTGSRISGTAHPAGTFIKYSSGTIYQIVKNAQGTPVRRKVASTSALRTLVPTSQIYPANSSDSGLAVDTWLRGYRDGTVLAFGDGSYGVIARGSLRKFVSKAAFNTLGYLPSNALAANGNAMPRESGQAYRVGALIERYLISTSEIKVTNKAGTSTKAVVLPSLGGLYGVGTFDPVPAGWDFTR